MVYFGFLLEFNDMVHFSFLLLKYISLLALLISTKIVCVFLMIPIHAEVKIKIISMSQRPNVLVIEKGMVLYYKMIFLCKFLYLYICTENLFETGFQRDLLKV